MKTIILSCAHGEEVQGKSSPCGTHKEYLWSRKIQYAIGYELSKKGVPVLFVPAKNVMKEPGLWNRVEAENRVNQSSFVFSLHNNAAGNGKQWMSARGVEIWTSKGQTKSDEYATLIFESLQRAFPTLNGNFPFAPYWRKDMRDKDVDKEENFVELMSKHPAVLLEWLFQDNKDDFALLQDDDVNSRLVFILSDVLYEIARS